MLSKLRSMASSLWLILISILILGCSATGVGKSSITSQPLIEQSLEEQWGVKVLSIKHSAGGYMLDFRYRVLDPEKALPLFDRKVKPHLVDEATGAVFAVPEPPKIGALRSTRPPKQDRNYSVMFANPGGYVKKDSKVSVVIGDFKAENLVVQ